MSAVKKRHQPPSDKGSRGGKKQKVSDEADELDFEDKMDVEREEEARNSGVPTLRTFSVADIENISEEALCEFEQAETAGPLFAASEIFTEHVARLCALSAPSLDMDTVIAWMENGSDESAPSLTPCIRLTAEQKLILAQEDRGMVVPDRDKQKQLLTQAHAAGHFGEKAMYHHIQQQGFWWPYMRKDIGQIIQDCNDCQRYTVVQHGYHPARSVVALRPGDHYQIDLAQFSKATDGSVFCLVLVDVCTGFMMLRPLKVKTAQAVAHALWHIFSVIGVPRVLQSDNGSEFLNETIRALTQKLGIERRFISEYNPRADGKVERAVRTVKQTVMKLLHGATVYWPQHLPFVQYSYNNKVQTLTGSAPFALMFGRQANAASDYTTDPSTHLPVDLAVWKKHQEQVLSLVFPSVNERAGKQQLAYRTRLDNMRRKLIKEGLVPGTKVCVKDPKYLLAPRPGQEPPYIGVYTVVRQNKYGAYILRDEHGKIENRSVPIDQIKVGASPDIVPVNSDDLAAVTYDVEKILSHREEKGEIMYHVKWKDYPLSQATWENEHQFNDTAIIDRYWRTRAADNIAAQPRVAIRCMRAGRVDLTSHRQIAYA